MGTWVFYESCARASGSPRRTRAQDNYALKGAAENGHIAVIRELRYGFGLTSTDARAGDNCALDCAPESGHVGALRELREGFGLTASDARATDNYALRWATQNGHVDVLRELRDGFGLTSADVQEAVANLKGENWRERDEWQTEQDARKSWISLLYREWSIVDTSSLEIEHAAIRTLIVLECESEFAGILRTNLSIDATHLRELVATDRSSGFEMPETCAVCLEPLLLRALASIALAPADYRLFPETALGITACGHAFHAACVNQLLMSASQGACPLCRAPNALASGNRLTLRAETEQLASDFVSRVCEAIAGRRLFPRT